MNEMEKRYETSDCTHSEVCHNMDIIGCSREKCEDYSMPTPKHETVDQWEKRTGETYPDDGPVYVWSVNNPTCLKRWVLMEYSFSGWYRSTCKIIVANHNGKSEI